MNQQPPQTVDLPQKTAPQCLVLDVVISLPDAQARLIALRSRMIRHLSDDWTGMRTVDPEVSKDFATVSSAILLMEEKRKRRAL